MIKRWTLVAHPSYFKTLIRVIPSPDERYKFVQAVWDRLEKTDNPIQDAVMVPMEPIRYELKLRGHTLVFSLPLDRSNDIDLLEIY